MLKAAFLAAHPLASIPIGYVATPAFRHGEVIQDGPSMASGFRQSLLGL